MCDYESDALSAVSFVLQCAILLYIPIAFPALAYSQCNNGLGLGCGFIGLAITACSFIIGALFITRVLDGRLSMLGCFIVGLANTVSIALSAERSLTWLSQNKEHVDNWVKYLIVVAVAVVWYASYCFCMKWSAVRVGIHDYDWFPLTFLCLIPKRARQGLTTWITSSDLENAVPNVSDEQTGHAGEGISLRTQTPPYKYNKLPGHDDYPAETHS